MIALNVEEATSQPVAWLITDPCTIERMQNQSNPNKMLLLGIKVIRIDKQAPPLSDFESGFPCPYCYKVLKHKANLTVHIRDHHSESSVIRHECDYCEKTFKSSGSLRDHKSKYHKFT